MKWSSNIFKDNKYLKFEVLFFVSIMFLIPVLSDLEYAYYERPVYFKDGSYPTSIIRRLIWGCFRIVPYYLFYKLVIERLLIPKKYLLSIFWFIFFVSFLDIYSLFMHKCISLMYFLPVELINESKAVINKPYSFHFNLNYMLKELFLMAGLAYFIHYKEQQEKIASMKALQLQSELNNLKVQLQPHFFFNTLNNIYSLALNKSEKTALIVAQLAEMMRYVLYKTNKDKVSLEKEVAFLQNYISVQSIRYDSRFAINFDTQGISQTALIEPLLLLPYIENTFKHGLEGEVTNGFIDIVICLNEHELTLSTTNKKTISTHEKNKARGIGMKNTEKRLALLYPDRHNITIEESDDIYKLTLTIFLTSHD